MYFRKNYQVNRPVSHIKRESYDVNSKPRVSVASASGRVWLEGRLLEKTEDYIGKIQTDDGKVLSIDLGNYCCSEKHCNHLVYRRVC